MRKTLYSVLGMISFAAFIVHYIANGLPHLPLLMGAMFFSVLFKLEEQTPKK